MMRSLIFMMAVTACYTPDLSADGGLNACGSGCPEKTHCRKGFCLPGETSAADAGVVADSGNALTDTGTTPADAGPGQDTGVPTPADAGPAQDTGVPNESLVHCDGTTGIRTVGTYASGWRNIIHCQDGVGPSAHWTFDGDLNERLGNPSLAATGTHQLTNAPLGQAVHSIEGGLTVASHRALEITTQTGGTITAWVRFPNAIGVNEGLISRFVSGAPDFVLNNYAILFDQAQLRMMGNGNNEAPRREWGADTNWHFLAFVYDGNNSRYFVDGEPLGNAFNIDRSSTPGSSLNTVIGQGPNSEVFNGQIDDLAIYQRPLDSASIRALYDVSGADGSDTDNASRSCAVLHEDYPDLISAAYYIDPDDANGTSPFEVYCDMETAGGGWTLIAVERDTVVDGPIFSNNYCSSLNTTCSGKAHLESRRGEYLLLADDGWVQIRYIETDRFGQYATLTNSLPQSITSFENAVTVIASSETLLGNTQMSRLYVDSRGIALNPINSGDTPWWTMNWAESPAHFQADATAYAALLYRAPQQ
jgi:hypothetical protein